MKYPPPLIPPRGEVNAADAFDIGNFDDEDTKGIKLSEADQDLYKNFPLVVSERWQQEIAETVFEVINQDTDKLEMKRRQKPRVEQSEESFGPTDCIVEGEVLKLGGPFLQTWQKKHLKLYPNRLEFYPKNRDGQVVKGKGVELIPMTDIQEVIPDFQKINKMENCIVLHMKNDTKVAITSPDRVLINQWKDEMINGFRLSSRIMANMNRKVRSKYGAADPAAARSLDGMSPTQNNSFEKGSSEES